MLAIKLQRIGKKHQPSYRLVVAEKKSKMAAPPVEDLGSYAPSSKTLSAKRERVEYWIGKGAKPTVTVHNLLVNNKIVSAAHRAVKMKKAEAVPAAPVSVQAPAASEESAAPTT